MFRRKLNLPPAGRESFFLWGPRQTGKTTLLRQSYADALWIDLLKADEFRRYTVNPEYLRQEINARGTAGLPRGQVVIDEVQKSPALLDEVHWLIENRGLSFALCGSSARKVRRGSANLLGGRALRYRLHGLTAGELGAEFDLARILNHGYLPRMYQASRPGRLLDAYVADYLKEEIVAEGFARNLPAFSAFLDAAALSDTAPVNYSNISRDCGVSSHTVRSYFGILEDTLLISSLPSFRRRAKRRVVSAPKYYFGDVGVVNQLARRGVLHPGGELFGKAMENWVHHELRAYLDYSNHAEELAYWRTAGGVEVDFIVGDMRVALEVKSSARISQRHLRGLRSLQREYPELARLIVVCQEPKHRRTGDGIDVLPAREFVRLLWQDALI